jgi:tetratricopeptide (TPR) repeat protein
MKATERHKLKENEFARTVAHAREVFEQRGREFGLVVLAVVVALAAVGGYTWWRQSRSAKATALLADALVVHEAPVVAPQEPKPGSPMPVQQPGTYRTEQAKLEAALPKFMQAADSYPSTEAGIAARFHLAGILAELGRHGEAEQRYQEVIDRGGRTIYARTARLGLAEAQLAQGKFDSAIAIYRDLTTESNPQLPVDGVLMQLGRACLKAGKNEDAARAFNRVVEEFPDSVYVADARREMEAARKG